MKGQGSHETLNVECEIQAQAVSTFESKRFDLPLGCVNSGFERLGVFRAERFDLPLGCVYSGFERRCFYSRVNGKKRDSRKDGKQHRNRRDMCATAVVR